MQLVTETENQECYQQLAGLPVYLLVTPANATLLDLGPAWANVEEECLTSGIYFSAIDAETELACQIWQDSAMRLLICAETAAMLTEVLYALPSGYALGARVANFLDTEEEAVA
jgi:hypothetical protein